MQPINKRGKPNEPGLETAFIGDTTMPAKSAGPGCQRVLTVSPASNWLQSPEYDLSFFVLSPLLGLVWLLTVPGEAGILIVLAMLGIPHYLSTFTFYFWDDNNHYHRSRWAAFFVGPLSIILVVTALVSFRIPYILQVAVYFWNILHVARQSCGILSIYRHRAGVFDPRQKALANAAIIASNGCLAVWNLAWHPTLYRFLSLVAPVLPRLLWLSFGAVAVIALLRLGVSLWKRCGTSHAPSLPEIYFLFTSLGLFHPYLWVQDGSRATTGMLIGHFVQYLGIVWLLHRRKFKGLSESSTPCWLVRLSSNTRLLLLVLLATGCVYLVLKQLFTLLSVAVAFDSVLFMLVFMHFYLDGLFWAFKEPHIRRSLGPSLLSDTSGRTAAG